MIEERQCDKVLCPCDEPCPMTYALKLLGGKWKIPILCTLKLNGPTRYNELMRKIEGITNTMLASSLKELENDGLVKRKQYLEVPIRVEYSLTENSQYLFPAFDELYKFSKAMMNKNCK